MKTNKKFMLLSALGIIFVLDDHAGTPLNFFASIFPYNSFYMPMFVFISGYFFKAESCIKLRDYFVRKAKTFLIPYLAYSMIYYVLNMVTNYYNLTQWEIPSLPHFFKVCWTSGTPVELSSSSWFVMVLFHVVMIHALIRKLFYKVWNDFVALVFYIAAGGVATYISHNGLFSEEMLLVIKVLFFIQFYQLGVCYKKFFERRLEKVSPICIVSACIILSIMIRCIYGEKICFNSCAFMGGFLTNNYFLPLFTSILGILFWTVIAQVLVESLGKSRFLNFISDNTFFIMMNHLLFYTMLNTFFYFINASGFNETVFRTTVWYQYRPIPQFGVLYIIFAITMTVAVKFLLKEIRRGVLKVFET